MRSLLLGEGVALAFLGGVIGALGGLAYAKAMLHGLTTIWRDAVGASALSFHFTAQTLVIGLFASVVVSRGHDLADAAEVCETPCAGIARRGNRRRPSLKSKV